MLDISSINAISGILAAIGVIVGVVFAVLQLRDLVRTRRTDLVMRLGSTFGSKDFQEAWTSMSRWQFKDSDDFMKEYGHLDENWVTLNSVAVLFEDIGVLLHRKLIDIALVDDLFSTPIKLTWEKIKTIVEYRRKRFKRPQIWEWFEYLYNEMKKREQALQAQY